MRQLMQTAKALPFYDVDYIALWPILWPPYLMACQMKVVQICLFVGMLALMVVSNIVVKAATFAGSFT
jgi:hypothetical protein